VIEHLRGQVAYRQQQAKRLTALAAGDASRADALEESLVFVLTLLQPAATHFSFPNRELTSRKSSAVVIDDEQALDPAWLSFTTTSKPDKAAIKEPSRPASRSPVPSSSPAAPGASAEGAKPPRRSGPG